jgi:hypothetical protein
MIDNGLQIPNPAFIIILGLIIFYAAIRGKHHKVLAQISFFSLLIFSAINLNFTHNFILESPALIITASVSFLLFFFGSAAWIVLDIIKHKGSKRNSKPS